MERIIGDLLNGKMNWRKKLLWTIGGVIGAAVAALAVWAVIVAYFVLVTRLNQFLDWVMS